MFSYQLSVVSFVLACFL